MTREIGRGYKALFDKGSQRPNPKPRAPRRDRRMRTSITLTQEDADRLELLRMHLRRQKGRGLTISNVVCLALKHLAEAESLPSIPPPHQET